MNRARAGSKVAVLGASDKEDRYSFKAVRMLAEHGYKPIPIHPSGHVVDGITALKSLSELTEPVDTLTLYVNAKISSGQFDQIIRLNPRRAVFNPGAENSELEDKLKIAGIEVVEACTLVLLRTEQF